MNGELPDVKDAQDHVEDHPGKRNPARPVAASEKENSTDQGDDFSEFHEEVIGMKCMQTQQFAEMEDESNRAYDYVETRD